MIAFAFAGPIPFSSVNSSTEAALRLTHAFDSVCTTVFASTALSAAEPVTTRVSSVLEMSWAWAETVPNKLSETLNITTMVKNNRIEIS